MPLCLIIHDFILLKMPEIVTLVQMRKSQEVSQHLDSFFFRDKCSKVGLANMPPPPVKIGLSNLKYIQYAYANFHFNLLMVLKYIY